MAHRPFTPLQQRQNAAFLAALRRTGNVRLACRELGVHRGTYTKRRGRCAAFAAEWDMVLAAAHAAFEQAGGERMPAAGKGNGPGTGPRPCPRSGLRTSGGEPMIVRLGNGRLQLRLAPPGRMTQAAEQLFFETVGETANLRIAAAAAGFAHSSFLARARLRPAVAHELAVQRRIGRDRVTWQWLEATRTAVDDCHCDPDRPMPVMTAAEAIQQLRYHAAEGPFQYQLWCRRRPPPPFAALAPRIMVKFQAWHRARHYAATGSWRYPDE